MIQEDDIEAMIEILENCGYKVIEG